MIAFKPGNGGHGPEAYDTDTGQYVEVECEIEGQKFTGWEKLRDMILDSDPSLRQQYDSNSNNKAQIEDYIKNELYGPLLEERINKLNDENEGRVFFNSPTDAAENGYKLFTPKLFDMYKNMAKDGKIMVNKKLEYEVNALACCLQNSRYPKKKMNKITEKEYNVLMNSVVGTISSNTRGTLMQQRNYLRNNPNGFPVWRGMGLSKLSNMSDKNEVVRGYYDENSPYFSMLASANRGGYYGSVIYMSMSNDYAMNYQTSWTSSPGVLVKGFVRNPDKLNILECSLSDGSSYSSDCNVAFREINEFRTREQTFLNNVRKQAEKNGNMSYSEINDFMNDLSLNIRNNPGLCGIILGYDAIMGSSSQFDILNPGIVDVVEV